MGSLIDNICFVSISEVDNVSVFTAINCSLSCMYMYTSGVMDVMPENVHVHERISYSSDFITSFKTNVNTISKKVRKQIFAHRIWKPRNKERHTLLAVKPLVQSKHLNFVCLNIR